MLHVVFLRLFFVVIALGGMHVSNLKAESTYDYSQLRISKIEIEWDQKGGQTNDNSASIKKRLKSKEGDLFSQSAFDEDLKMLSQEFDKVDPKIETAQDSIVMHIKLWVKPIIRSLVWQGNARYNAKQLGKELGIHPKMVYDKQGFIKAFHKLKTFYVRKGFFEAECNYTVKRDPISNEVDITVAVKEGRAGKIKKIAFHGFTRQERDALTDLIFTKKYNALTSWFNQTGTHNPDVMRQDQLVMINYLQNKGYADAKVDIALSDAKEKNRIIINVSADKGAIYHFGKVSVDGNTLFKTDQLIKATGIKQGEHFSPDKLRDASKALSHLYGDKGYIDVLVTQQASLSEGSNSYNCNFQIEEGEKFRVGLIRVFGNKFTDTSVILHEALVIPGDIFNESLLKKTEERLQNIGYFKNVNVYAVKTERGSGGGVHFRDVHIEVEETGTGHLGAFLGFSTTESFYGGIKISESNFNHKGFAQVFSKGYRSFRGGGEYASFDTTIGTKQLSYQLSWTKPYFMDTPWIIGFDLHKTRNSFASDDYSIRSYGAELHAKYPLNPFLKFGWHYRIHHSDIKLHGIHRRKRQNRQLIRESKNGGTISASGIGLFYDSTDSPRAPTQGIRSTLSTEYAGLGGDHTFASLNYLNALYYTPFSVDKGVFKFRGDLKFIKTLGSTKPRNLPLDERYFMGGEGSVRGYKFNHLGPHFKDEERTPRGGVSEVLLSAEYNMPIFKRLDGFVFFDAGNVYFSEFHIGKLRYSTGYGIKLKVFEQGPPLVFGMGYPLNSKNKRDVKHFYFSLGASF